MDAIHPVRVLLFWDPEIARDEYSPYFTGVIQKSWIANEPKDITCRTGKKNIEISRYGSQSLKRSNDDDGAFILRKASYTVSITYDRNTINMTEHVTVITQMISDKPSILYPTVNDDEDEIVIRAKIMSYLVNLNQTITMTEKKKSYKLP
ncbi:hypothetical protein M9H77_34458 [Catharanthus roseus]|uniref:Uncharacterized protein n=1 Tax=Catharanthus roseus TaxID=4058 RepID=A0ACB9ZLI3_CATRO|nr:hypothetical protein M9H77_34458 [Catharanthus roseus]